MSVPHRQNDPAIADPTPVGDGFPAPDDRLQQVEETLLALVRLLARSEARRFRRSCRGVTRIRVLAAIGLLGLTVVIAAVLLSLP